MAGWHTVEMNSYNMQVFVEFMNECRKVDNMSGTDVIDGSYEYFPITYLEASH